METARKADMKAAEDRRESISLMEPLLIGEGSPHRPGLTDLVLALAQKSAGFRQSLPEALLTALADLVRAMNCYYSNLIEGHDTHPIEIERALKGDYSNDARKRDLQLEAKAHITAQKWIDDGALRGRAVTVASIREIHRRFCELPPDDLLWIEDPTTKERVKMRAGELRQRDVAVGRHVPVSPPAIPRFFLVTCLDQVSFMESLLRPDRLRARILLWAEEEIRLDRLPPRSGAILEAVLYRGEIPRADTASIVGTGERQARRIVSALLERGVLQSESTRAPLRLALPAAFAPRWMPGLFPESPA